MESIKSSVDIFCPKGQTSFSLINSQVFSVMKIRAIFNLQFIHNLRTTPTIDNIYIYIKFFPIKREEITR